MSPNSQTVAVGPWRSLLPVFAACGAIGLQAGVALPLVPLALLARSVADEAIVHILNNAIASVRSGELRGTDGTPP